MTRDSLRTEKLKNKVKFKNIYHIIPGEITTEYIDKMKGLSYRACIATVCDHLRYDLYDMGDNKYFDNKYFCMLMSLLNEKVKPMANSINKNIGSDNLYKFMDSFKAFFKLSQNKAYLDLEDYIKEANLDFVNLFQLFHNLSFTSKNTIVCNFNFISKILIHNFNKKEQYEIIKYFLMRNLDWLDDYYDKDGIIVDDLLIAGSEGKLVDRGYYDTIISADDDLLTRKDKKEKYRLLNDDEITEFTQDVYKTCKEAYTSLYNLDTFDIELGRERLSKLAVADEIIDNICEIACKKKHAAETKKEVPVIKEIVIKKEESVKKETISEKEFKILNHKIKDLYNIDTKELIKPNLNYEDMIFVVAVLIKMLIDPNDIIEFLKKASKANNDILSNYKNYLRDKILYLDPERVPVLDEYYKEALENKEEWLDIFQDELNKFDNTEYLYEIHEAVQLIKK